VPLGCDELRNSLRLAFGMPDGVNTLSGMLPVSVRVCCPSMNNLVVAVVASYSL